MEMFNSPVEITTIFFLLSVVSYIAAAWYTQTRGKPVGFPIKRPAKPVPTAAHGDVIVEQRIIDRFFDNDSDSDRITTH